MRPFFVLACFFTFVPFADAQAKVKEAEPTYVGEVIIVGNTVTQDRVIRAVLQDIQPGQILRYPDLRLAEKNLARLGLFEVHAKKGIRPTIHVLDSPGPFKDILVKVEETSTHTFKPVFAFNPQVGFAVAFVFEERNFDWARLPTSVADFYEAKVFRGGGQKLQLGITLGPVMAPRLYWKFTDYLSP